MVQLKSLPCCDFAWCGVVVGYQCFRKMYQTHLQGSGTALPMKIGGAILRSKTLVVIYQSMLHDNPE